MVKRLMMFMATVMVSLVCAAQDADIKIVGVNDMHSAVQNMPRLAYVVDSIRAKHPDVIVLAAGDNRTGNPVNDLYTEPNFPMVAIMNEIGFNGSAMGNHECDSDVPSFANTVNKSKFPYLAANVHPADTLGVHIQPFRFIETQGVRVGILGVIQVNKFGHPDCHPGKVLGIRFTDPFKETEKYAWMRGQCEVMVALTHLGIEEDTLYADKFPMFDVIVGGHSHDLISGMMRNGVMITQAKKSAEFCNEIDIKVRGGKVVEKKCKTISVKNAGGENEKVKKMVAEFSDNPMLTRKLTSAVNPFEKKEELGCMMADAMVEETKASIAIVNNGSVRYETKEKGNITVGDVLRLDPFGNETILVDMSGEELASLLEAMPTLDEYGAAYVSGITYTIGKEKKSGKEKVAIKAADGGKFNMQKRYRVAISSYIVSLARMIDNMPKENTFITTSDLLIRYLEKQGAVDYKGAKRVFEK